MVSKVVFSHMSDEYITPELLYKELDSQLIFELDAATSPTNPLNPRFYFTKADDGLKQIWPPVNTFVNPPYSRVKKWIVKAHKQFIINSNVNPDLAIIMLVAARTDTRWSHDIVIQAMREGYCSIEFLRGRIKFRNTKNSSPFPSMLIKFSLKNLMSYFESDLSVSL